MTTSDDLVEALRARLAASERFIVVVAGSNGAGKTTFVNERLTPSGLRVVNPDQIAKALSADVTNAAASYEAARVADAWRRDLLQREESCCMETVLSDPYGAKLGFLREAQARGYLIFLVFIGLESAELSSARVAQRVEEGGHDVPDEKIKDRYQRTLTNLGEAVKFVDHTFLFDNSSADDPYRFVAEFREGSLVSSGSARPGWAADLVSSADAPQGPNSSGSGE